MNKFLLQKKNGYALMFTVIIVSIISLIAVGLSNATYKQILLASIARDSQTAFYMADTIVECIEYEDNVTGRFSGTYGGGTTFKCGINNSNTDYVLSVTSPSAGNFTIKLADETVITPCFTGTVAKTTGNIAGVDVINTAILGYGYNICNRNNPRTVERTIKANY